MSKVNLSELSEAYLNLRGLLLERAEQYGFTPYYAYENQSGIETPEAFSTRDLCVSNKNTKLLALMTMGTLEQIKEVLDDPELINEYLKEIFGERYEYEVENQTRLEAA